MLLKWVVSGSDPSLQHTPLSQLKRKIDLFGLFSYWLVSDDGYNCYTLLHS